MALPITTSALELHIYLELLEQNISNERAEQLSEYITGGILCDNSELVVEELESIGAALTNTAKEIKSKWH